MFILFNATVGCSRSPNELVHRELLLPILPTFVLDRALLDRIDDIVTRGTMINPAEQLPESSAGTDSEAPLEVNPICGALGPDRVQAAAFRWAPPPSWVRRLRGESTSTTPAA